MNIFITALFAPSLPSSQETLSVIPPKVLTSAFSRPSLLSALQIVWNREDEYLAWRIIKIRINMKHSIMGMKEANTRIVALGSTRINELDSGLDSDIWTKKWRVELLLRNHGT